MSYVFVVHIVYGSIQTRGSLPALYSMGVGLQIDYFHSGQFTRYEVTDHMISIISEQILLIPDNLYIAL